MTTPWKALGPLVVSVLWPGVGASGGPIKREETFFYNLAQAPATLNPLRTSLHDAGAVGVQRLVMESLLSRSSKDSRWHSGLAQRWEVSPDGTSYTFTLAQGVRWHDGRPFGPEDVKFTFEAILDPQNSYKAAHRRPPLEGIQSVEILTGHRVRFSMKENNVNHFGAVATTPIVARHRFEGKAPPPKRTLVGTGPYFLKIYRPGKGILLRANPQRGNPSFPQIFMRFVKGPHVALALLEKGDLDFLVLTPQDYLHKTHGKKWGKDVIKQKVRNLSPRGVSFIGWNLRRPLFSSLKVRQALAHLYPRQLVAEKIFQNTVSLARGPLYHQGLYAHLEVAPIPFGPARAWKLLKEDGWRMGPSKKLMKNNMALSFTIVFAANWEPKGLSLFQQEAKKIGIEIKAQPLGPRALAQRLKDGRFEGAAVNLWPGGILWNPEPLWHSRRAHGGGNFTGHQNPRVDWAIDQAKGLISEERRRELLREVYKIVAESVPGIFLFNSEFTFYAYRKRIHRPRPTDPYGLGWESWRLKKDEYGPPSLPLEAATHRSLLGTFSPRPGGD